MIAWVNFSFLLLASLLFLLFYNSSVSPAGLAKIIGESAYVKCARDRVIAVVFETIIAVNYLLYYFYPLETPLPRSFPWDWWISILIAALIGLPSAYLMFIGLKDAGEEAIRPKVEHTMYGGIYRRIRHPQAVGEVFLFPVMGFLVNSPFLVLFSLLYFPIFYIMCRAEEQDLLLRFGEPYADYCRKVGAFFPKRGSTH